MSKTTVRVAESADIPQLITAYDWLFAPPGSTPADWDPAVAEKRLAQTLADPSSGVLVAVDDGRLVGFCTMYLDIESVRFGQRCWVEDLAVDPDQRSAGIGASLLTRARQWSAEHGASHLELNSGTARVDAHRFYNRHQPTAHALNFGWQTPEYTITS